MTDREVALDLRHESGRLAELLVSRERPRLFAVVGEEALIAFLCECLEVVCREGNLLGDVAEFAKRAIRL